MNFLERWLNVLVEIMEGEKAFDKASKIMGEVQTHNSINAEVVEDARKNNLICPCCTGYNIGHDAQFNTCATCKHVWSYIESPEKDLQKELVAARIVQVGSEYRYKLFTPGTILLAVMAFLAITGFIMIFTGHGEVIYG